MTENRIKILIRDVQLQEPTYVLDLPPSDNLRLGVYAWIDKKSRKAKARIILTAKARDYINTTRGSLGAPVVEVKRGGDEVYGAPEEAKEGWQYFLIYKPYFPNLVKRDAGNYKKILEDTLFSEDKSVYTWPLPAEVDAENPRLVVWIYTVYSGGGL